MYSLVYLMSYVSVLFQCVSYVRQNITYSIYGHQTIMEMVPGHIKAVSKLGCQATTHCHYLTHLSKFMFPGHSTL